MSRTTRQDADAPSHDSFLDIVANMVGILIILVMVAGVRVKNAPVVAAISASAAAVDPELEKQQAAESSLRVEVLKLGEEMQKLQVESLVRGRHRDALATAALTVEHKIESRRRQMDGQAQARFDLERTLVEAKLQREELDRQRTLLDATRAEPVQIKSYPTPLSKAVSGREAHFQLRGGRIVFIPVDQLIVKLKEDARKQQYKLRDLPEFANTIGPIRGFRLRYTFERHDIPPEVAMETGVGGAYAQLKLWTLIPVSSQMGEPVDRALDEGSEFRQILSSFHPGRSTITIWTYQDSFASFRRLKKELYRLGYATAARPLPMETPISGSPHGSKSTAE